MVAAKLDSVEAMERALHFMTWMPAHTSKASLGFNVKICGSGQHSLVSPLDWRANRLADLAAKAALLGYGLDKMSVDLLAARKDVCKKLLVLLANVTYTANNHVSSTVVDGVPSAQIIRDSTGLQRRTQRKKRGSPQCTVSHDAQAALPHTLLATYVPKKNVDPFHTPPRRRRVLARAALKRKVNNARDVRAAACFTACMHAKRQHMVGMPPGYLANVLERIRLRIREAAQAASMASDGDDPWS